VGKGFFEGIVLTLMQALFLLLLCGGEGVCANGDIQALDDEAEALVKKLWRMVIYYSETEKRGIK
jgi:hypothetical protein